MIVFHHNDADGRCAAAVVRKWALANPSPWPEEEGNRLNFIEMDYKSTCPVELLLPRETVVIVDFSFRPDIMDKIFARNGLGIIWCDHHATAKDYGYDVAGYRDFSEKGLSGCECTWRFFFPRDPIPTALSLLGDYDAWRLEQKPRCFEFYEGLKLEDQCPESVMWEQLLSGDDSSSLEERIIERGRTAILYRDNYCSELRQAFGYETEIDGVEAYVLNTARFGSNAFGEKFNQYPVCIMFIHDGQKFTVSLYSETVDVSEIAKRYGGGGHKGASGFICAKLPWGVACH